MTLAARNGRIYSAVTQDPASMIATTAPKEKANSPSVPSRISIGIKAATVVTEATARGIANCRPVTIAASCGFSPRRIRVWISSTTTTPLSTSKPSEIMTAAIEICSRAMPMYCIPRRPIITVNGTIIATAKAGLSPKNTSKTNRTTRKVCATF